MTDNLDELIERLLDYLVVCAGQALDTRCQYTEELIKEAADALTALKAERDALRAAIAWVNEVHPTNCDGYARVGMTFEEFAAMKAALQQKDRNDEN